MINCTITTAKGTKRYSGLRSVLLPASSGQIEILPGHAESFLLLAKGDIILNSKTGGKEKRPIEGAGCYMQNDELMIVL